MNAKIIHPVTCKALEQTSVVGTMKQPVKCGYSGSRLKSIVSTVKM